jgi:hypothetical protein
MPQIITMGVINAIMLAFAIVDQLYPGGLKQLVIEIRERKYKDKP